MIKDILNVFIVFFYKKRGRLEELFQQTVVWHLDVLDKRSDCIKNFPWDKENKKFKSISSCYVSPNLFM